MAKSTAMNLIDPKRVKELMRDGGKNILTDKPKKGSKDNYIEILDAEAAGFVINYLVEVTPQVAEEWLKKNPLNRNPSQRKINRYSAMMKDGQFDLNGETIKFTDKGILLDGQSRLRAIIRAKKMMLMEVRVGLSPRTQHTMDTGENRELAHHLQMDGYKNATTVASVLRLFHLYIATNGQLSAAAGSQFYYFTHRQALDLIKRHPALKETALYCMDPRVRKILPSGKMGTLKYLFHESKNSRAESFFSKIKTGVGMNAGDPVLALRTRILTALEEGEPMSPKLRMVLVVKAWNAYRANKKLSWLTATKGEAVPAIEGNPFLKK